MADEDKKFKEQLMTLPDDELEMMASTSPGMSNMHVKAEVARRKKMKGDKTKPGLNYGNSPQEE